MLFPRPLVVCICASVAIAVGCKRMQRHNDEHVYVVSKETFLRDRVAAVSNKVAAVHNGDRLTVVEHGRRFLRVRTDQGQEGWLEEHAAIDQQTYDAFTRLRQQHANDPVVATGILRDELYAHLAPGRDSDRFLLLPENDKLQLLMRASIAKPTPEQAFQAAARRQAARVDAEKQAQLAKLHRVETKSSGASAQAGPQHPASAVSANPPPQVSGAREGSAKSRAGKAGPEQAPPTQFEDWWLVRDGSGRVGWLLARRLDVDIPEEVVRYAEGQKIVGAYLLAKISDPDSPFPDHQAPEYLAVLNPYKDGLPYDFSMVRVFVWNPKKHRYEGGLRQKDLVGYLPVTVDQRTLDKAGPVPTFTLRLAADGAEPAIDPVTGLTRPVPTFNATYRLDGENVTRVLAPGEQPPTPASSASPEEQARHRERARLRAERAAALHHRR